MRETGIYETLGGLQYFIPHALPPQPNLVFTPEMIELYTQASIALAQLNEMSKKLPDQKRFIKAYVIKEALLSSSIEDIHTTLVEVFTQLLEDSKRSKDVQLVLNYTQALDAALHLMQDQGLPLVSRVILKAHEVLMSVGEGDKATPGHFRKQSVRVGNFVPPAATQIQKLMGDLEQYINMESDTSPLIKAGLAHLQFETIHPFLDGNGRIGRLLIVLMLIDGGLLKLPIIYPSYYFKKHRFEYYQRLDRVRTHGDFEGWILYYLQAIKESALDAHLRATNIERLEVKLKELIQSDLGFSNIKETATLVLEFLFRQPITTTVEISQSLDKAYNTVQKVLKEFENHSLVIETTGHKRNKVYRFEPYLICLEKEL